jgi:hypothetical protein
MQTATAPAEQRAPRLLVGVSAASTAAFRIGFGVLVAGATLRFLAKGWVETLYLAPAHHLTYARFEWVRPLPAPAMYALMWLLVAAGVGIALGWRTRWCAAVFFLGFGYTELIEASLYLNHYWFVTLAALLLVLVPTDGMWSLDARSGRRLANPLVPAYVVWALRAQIAVVYVFAGLAKVNSDWLVHGVPLRLWLSDRTSVPVVGPWLDDAWVGVAASWFGMVFDLTIVAWLLWRRSRPVAYLAVVAFHLATAALFQIGVFPWVMMFATLVFFPPDWPLRLGHWMGRGREPVVTPHAIDSLPVSPRPLDAGGHRVTLAVLGALAVVEIVLPLRHLAWPGDVRVTEEGYYLSWRVMLTEKAGLLDFRVTDPTTGDEWTVAPTVVLTDWQATQAAIRPDLALAAAHLLDDHYSRLLGRDVEVRADSFVSVNGREARRLIDPTIDLSGVSRTAPLHRIVVDEPDA